MDRALDRFQKRRGAKGRYDVKALTKAMLGNASEEDAAGQTEMLNRLEGDLDFLNQTLGSH